MNQLLDGLKALLGGLLLVAGAWHLFGLTAWLAKSSGSRHTRRRVTQSQNDPVRNVPIEPR
jgi:hypothetical protein